MTRTREKSIFGNSRSMSVRLTDELRDIGIDETTANSVKNQKVKTEVIMRKGVKGIFISKE